MTTTTDDIHHYNFLGIPVTGDPDRRSERPAQLPLSDFEPIIRAVLDDPTIVEFGWDQYTPYFNDGDPCVFGAGSVWVRTDTDGEPIGDDEYDDEDRDDEQLNVQYRHPSLGEFKDEYTWSDDAPRVRTTVKHEYIGPDQARLERALALNTAVEAGQFDDVLIEAFGDHCQVKISRKGISISHCEHH